MPFGFEPTHYLDGMTTRYRLHYAPDNASLIIRIALNELEVPYEAVLVDRAMHEQRSEAYRAINPNGLIPVLETPSGPVFETAAILLWLSETHQALAPQPTDAERGAFLKWLFFVSNTVHAELRLLFYPKQYIASDHAAALRAGIHKTLPQRFQRLEEVLADRPNWFGATNPTILDFYVCACCRWPQIYPAGQTDWFSLARFPRLTALCEAIETRASVQDTAHAEGLGPKPFSAAQPANPPEGSAI